MEAVRISLDVAISFANTQNVGSSYTIAKFIVFSISISTIDV